MRNLTIYTINIKKITILYNNNNRDDWPNVVGGVGDIIVSRLS